jgi:hypothetical protein
MEVRRNPIREYDVTDDPCIQRASYGGPENRGAFGFGIDGRGYIGLGYLTGWGNSNELWEYAPFDVGIGDVAQSVPTAQLQRYSAGSLHIRNLSDKALILNLFDGTGRLVLTQLIRGSEVRVGCNVALGLYTYEMESAGGGLRMKWRILLEGSR